jgi:signal transduction histidine kinase
MSDPATVAAAAYAVPALLWGSIAYGSVVEVRDFLPKTRFFVIFPVWSGLATFIFVVLSLGELAAPAPGTLLHLILTAVVAIGTVAFAAVLRHLIVGSASLVVPEQWTGRGWLIRNYGAAIVVAIVALTSHSLTGVAIGTAFVVVMGTLATWEVRARIQRGALRRTTLATQLHRADVAMLAVGAVVLLAAIAVGLTGAARHREADLAIAAVGSVGAVGPALRNLTAIVRRVVMTAATLGAAAGVYVGARALDASLASPLAQRFVDLGAILGLAFVLVPGRAWLGMSLDRLILRHGLRVRDELQAFLRTLSPELGVRECCRRALAEAVRAWHFRGAAILLDDGTALVEGDLALDPVRAVWPRGAAADELPAHAFIWLWVRDPALRTALATADVAGVLPITSPRRRWGHLLTSLGLLGWDKGREQVETGKIFCDQLALVLDGAELLARTIAVERSLAHAEKLAAIGETAARIAHEIRNPITAARSLAQQLAREPESRFHAEHEVILAELERVERQTASLLRFARREEPRLEPFDLGQLVRTTVEDLRPRLEAAGIGVAVDAPDGVLARADREKLRQVLINLVENAIDALGSTAGTRRVDLAVAGVNGSATIQVRDSGPGVPPDALPRLFEPFFSLKEHGTGLGLAIARRTIEAHGGTIDATSTPEGMTFRVSLPLAREAR